MEAILQDILTELRATDTLDDQLLARIIHKHNKNRDKRAHYPKRRLLPYYLKVKSSDPARWAGWDIDPALEKRLLSALQMKPRRTASGVATITVITKPWRCASDCLYCPNDLRMPKSYLSDEPACQRAERNYFDPYLQVISRLRALTHMGHPTDKVELIVLGGTWSDYPPTYQMWFVSELLRALNEGDRAQHHVKQRRAFYQSHGLTNREEELAQLVYPFQKQVDEGALTYNQATAQLYEENTVYQSIAATQKSDSDDLAKQHLVNETAAHRLVGLSIETRPDTINPGNLRLLRQLGCTKIQMGIQSLDSTILAANNRRVSLDQIAYSFELLRLFGFKIQVHFMRNLYGSSYARDIEDYRYLVTDKRYLPDEVKLYPCSLVAATRLCTYYNEGTWQPYREEELIDLLTTDTLVTPPYVRVSRMIRDISAQDILAGNKKTNLRQLVENRIEQTGGHISEIRHREIGTDEVDIDSLTLGTIAYETTVTSEYFLQWVTACDRIAGFLRLSLPKQEHLRQLQADLPVGLREAMIREVHIYGKVARLHNEGEDAQHLGLGRRLIQEACAIARAHGYERINVISSVGTRQYYRSLGFADKGLYQQMATLHKL